MYIKMRADGEPYVLSAITMLHCRLVDLVEPDFGLLYHLLSLQVLTPDQVADIGSESTVNRRNKALLKLLTSENQCAMFLLALHQTDQPHVANLVTQFGGENYDDLVTLQIDEYSRVMPDEQALLYQSHFFCL